MKWNFRLLHSSVKIHRPEFQALSSGFSYLFGCQLVPIDVKPLYMNRLKVRDPFE